MSNFRLSPTTRPAAAAFTAPAVVTRAAIAPTVAPVTSRSIAQPSPATLAAAAVVAQRAAAAAIPTRVIMTPTGPVTVPASALPVSVPSAATTGLSAPQAAALLVAQQTANPVTAAATPAFAPSPAAASASQASSGGGGSSNPGPAAASNDPAPTAPAVSASDPAAQAAAAMVAPSASTSTALATVPATSTALATTAPAPLSWWARFLAWLGFKPKAPATPAASTVSAHGESLPDIAGSLVRRARAGDQNAMGLLAVIGRNAKAGNATAVRSAAAINAYITANPVRSATMSSEPNDATFCEAIKLSHGATLIDSRVARFAHGEFGAEGAERSAFSHGVRNPHQAYPLRLPADLARAHRMGRTVGLARKLQAVRMHGQPLSDYDARVGYELGD